MGAQGPRGAPGDGPGVHLLELLLVVVELLLVVVVVLLLEELLLLLLLLLVEVLLAFKVLGKGGKAVPRSGRGHHCARNGVVRPARGRAAASWAKGGERRGGPQCWSAGEKVFARMPSVVRRVLPEGGRRPGRGGLVPEHIAVLVEDGHGRALVERHAGGHGAHLLLLLQEKGLHVRRYARTGRDALEPAHGRGSAHSGSAHVGGGVRGHAVGGERGRAFAVRRPLWQHG
mmetsp:Transcript_18892/g.72017  ORF Transcript_18892/g.72017 Transcript_18892/m.72017 type:complete len:230 (+) Transcript_18892:400-1089(+)